MVCLVGRPVRRIFVDGHYPDYPKLGPGLAFGLVIAGQLLVTVMLEHFNILVAEPHPISFLRLAGVGLFLGNVVLIRTF